jgi:hypothetical protein
MNIQHIGYVIRTDKNTRTDAAYAVFTVDGLFYANRYQGGALVAPWNSAGFKTMTELYEDMHRYNADVRIASEQEAVALAFADDENEEG